MSSDKVLVRFSSVTFRPKGRTMSFEIRPGDNYAVMGPACSGKSRLAECALGEAEPEEGKVSSKCASVAPDDGPKNRRTTPLSLAKAAAKKADSERLVGALSALGLTEVRDRPIGQLTTGQLVACNLLPCFVQDSELVVIDGHLDVLDPWLLDRILDLIEDDVNNGRAYLIVTNQPAIAERLGHVIVLSGGEPVFAGSVRELIQSCRPAELTVECNDGTTVRGIAEPFSLSVKAAPGKLELTTHSGQGLAARLLTHGYGNVKSVIVREPTLAEALARLP